MMTAAYTLWPVPSFFYCFSNLPSIFYKFQNDIFVKLNKVILELKTKCSHVNKDKEKLLPFPYGLLHLKDAMRELTKIDGHDSVESRMCELKKSNLMKLYVLMGQRQLADTAHFMDRITLAYLFFSESHSCPITDRDAFSHGSHSAKPMFPVSFVLCKSTLKQF